MDNNFDFYNNGSEKIQDEPTTNTENSCNAGDNTNFGAGYDCKNRVTESNTVNEYVGVPTQGQLYGDAYSNPYDYTMNNQSNYAINDFSVPKKKKSGKKALGIVAVFCALCLAGGGAFYAGAQYSINNIQNNQSTSANAAVTNATTVAATGDSEEVNGGVTKVVESAMPSMVSINTIVKKSVSNPYSYFYGYMFGDSDNNNTYETSGSGSGIIIGQNEEELLIVTNYHVVEDSSEIEAEFIDGESYTATVKGTASDNDLAVISVPIADISADTLSKIKVAVMGDSTNLKLGEPAIAIGNSLGYGQSVTVGYISATEREVQLTDKTMTLIQTDAAINPGNSGGALLNIKGEVIGINSAKYSDTSVEGTGYAIPISDATPIINSLMNSTYVEDESPYLGIYGKDVPASYQERLNWPAGVYVSQVESDSPASLAGLQAGDIITSIKGTDISTMEELQEILADCKVGDTVELSVTRSQNGNTTQSTLRATLIARSDVNDD